MTARKVKLLLKATENEIEFYEKGGVGREFKL